MPLSAARLALWAPVAAQLLVIAVACWRVRLAGLAAMACSGLTMVTILAALAVADGEALAAAGAAAAVFVAGIGGLIAILQRGPPGQDELVTSLSRLLDRYHLRLSARQMRRAAGALDRARAAKPDTRQDRIRGRKTSRRHGE